MTDLANIESEDQARQLSPVPAEELASTGMLSFYDRLRDRVTTAVEKRGGKLGQGAVEALLLAPDLFVLLVRLGLDSRVPKQQRRFLLGALAYFLTPIDLLPEGLMGPAGYLEDVVLAAAVLRMSLRTELEPLADDYWSGNQKLRVVLGNIAEISYDLLGPLLVLIGQRFLDRWGIRL